MGWWWVDEAAESAGCEWQTGLADPLLFPPEIPLLCQKLRRSKTRDFGQVWWSPSRAQAAAQSHNNRISNCSQAEGHGTREDWINLVKINTGGGEATLESQLLCSELQTIPSSLPLLCQLKQSQPALLCWLCFDQGICSTKERLRNTSSSL